MTTKTTRRFPATTTPTSAAKVWTTGQCDLIDPPVLLSVGLRVNELVVALPAEVSTDDLLEVVFEYAGSQVDIEDGYPFIVMNDEPNCLETQQLLSLNCPVQNEGICTIAVDPAMFLDGVGAPYGLEISNICGEHSNRLPLEIVAHDPQKGGETMKPASVKAWTMLYGRGCAWRFFVAICLCCDDDDDNDNDDDDFLAADDDQSPTVGCEGRDDESCEFDTRPYIGQPSLVVNGAPADFPAEVSTADHLEIVIEFFHPQCNIAGGYPFVVVDGDTTCLRDQPLRGVVCTSDADGPLVVELDPHFFLDGEGVSYGFRGLRRRRSPQQPVAAGDRRARGSRESETLTSKTVAAADEKISRPDRRFRTGGNLFFARA